MIKIVSQAIKNKTKKQKGRFLGVLLGTLGAGLFGNMLADKGAIATRTGKETIRAAEGTVTAGQDY